MVKGDGTAAKENKGKREGGQGEGKLVSVVAHQAIVEVYFDDSDGKVDADGEGGDTSEESEKNEQAAEEFGKRREVSRPARESETGDEIDVVVKSCKEILVAVREDDDTQGETHHEEREGLQTIEVAQAVPPRNER